ncbi:hypothetical protein [Longispora albida]|uniref:hypothetical protein n=1 Tax=Longispora albida TaxID=203523 RepID=UPI0003706EFF|nr:hypothetical protein [Longispora albida]
MKIRTTLVALTAILAVPLLAACGGDKDKDTPKGSPTAVSSSPQASPRDAFLASMKKLEGLPMTFSTDVMLSDGTAMKSTGQYDTANKKVSLTSVISGEGQKVTTKLLMVGPDLWMRIEGIPGAGEKWMHVNLDKLPATSETRKKLTAPANATQLAEALATVEQMGATSFYGTVDLTKMDGASGLDKAKLKDVTKTAFTATADKEGRLTKLSISLGTLGEIASTYTDFGKPVTVTAPPAAEVVEAPEQVLTTL